MNLPELFVKKMKPLLGEDWDKYLQSFNEKRVCGLRANTLKISAEKLKEMLPFDLQPVPWCPDGFYYDEGERPSKHPFYDAGMFYIQEPSAMSTASLVPIEKGDKVLDLCAAPGGKSTQLASRLQGSGLLVSNDISASRCKALLKNIELFGVKNAIITNETPEKLASRFEGFFDKIIVDAPCSGEGMFRKDDNAVKSWEEHKTKMCCEMQREILHFTAKLLADNGIIAYSTCTFAPEEDEGMINEFLSAHPDFELLEVDKALGFDYGKSEWVENGSDELKKCGRLWPYKIKGEGHFLALLRKTSSTYAPETPLISSSVSCPEFDEFCKGSLNLEKPYENLVMFGKNLISMPYPVDLSGLRVVRSGLLLGELKSKRFEPSQALAMSLTKNEAKITLDLTLEDEMLKNYLRGDSFKVELPDGYCLVTLYGNPLGWGKVQNGRLKNKRLAGWIN